MAPRRGEPSPPHQGARKSAFRTDIEGLRGIAVLLVVAYHAGVPGTLGGFIGVDVFFVLSGYLITGLIVKEIESKGRLDLVQFYARRARRLLPASAIVLLTTVVAGMVVLSPLEQQVLARTALATAAYLSNVWFLRESSDYFAADAETNPLLHTWSLAVEEQFYFVWPVLIMLVLRGGRSRRSLVIAMVGVTILSFAGSVWLTRVNQPWAFFGSPARAWEFSVGALAGLIPAAYLATRTVWSRAAGWLGLILVLAAGALFSSEMSFPGTAALLPAAGTILVLIAGVGAPGAGVGRLLDAPVLQRLGQLSYSWYLWHWPVLVLAAAVAPTLPLYGRVICALGALGLAAATYVLVENPVRFSPRLAPRPVLSLGLAAVVTMGGIGTASALHGSALRAAESPRYQRFATAVQDFPDLYQRDGCVASYTDSQPRACTFGDASSPTEVVLLGDSHAAQWFPALERIAVRQGWRLTTLIKPACPTARVPIFDPKLKRSNTACEAWREAALEKVATLRPEAVVLSNSVVYVEGAERRGGYSQLTDQQWSEGMRQTLHALSSAGVRTLLLRDTPRPGYDVPTCLSRQVSRPWSTDDGCTMRRSAVLDRAVFQAERRAAEGLPLVSLLDLTDEFCGPVFCSAVQDGVVIYRDTDHLTAEFAERLSATLEESILPLVAPQEQPRAAEAAAMAEARASDPRTS